MPERVAANSWSSKTKCWSGASDGNFFLRGRCNDCHDDSYHGHGLFYGNSRHRFRDILDGLSHTFMVGERDGRLGAR
ncbi:MAG: DUF1559 domain-containing protein [Rubripirellula sp.]